MMKTIKNILKKGLMRMGENQLKYGAIWKNKVKAKASYRLTFHPDYFLLSQEIHYFCSESYFLYITNQKHAFSLFKPLNPIS